MQTNTTLATPDYLNRSEGVSYRLGAAIRDQAIPAFIAACYQAELTEMAQVATALRPMVSEPTYLAITAALYQRTEQLDAAAARTKAKGLRGHRKFTKLADLAQAAQVAWTAANMAFLQARRAK
jgi:hypothetical protein